MLKDIKVIFSLDSKILSSILLDFSKMNIINNKWVLKRREGSGFARVNKVTSASLGYPLSVFNKNSTLTSNFANFCEFPSNND